MLIDQEQLIEQPAVVAEGQNLIKACLFNLIIIAEDVEAAMHCQELVRIITEKFPCRIIFVRIDKTAQSDFLQLTRSVQIVGAGATSICCDQIAIDASLNQSHKIPFIIFPQIVPDLPVYILLSKDPTKETLPFLQKYATRVIFDVPAVENYGRFSEQLLALLQHNALDYVDMHWARTKAWREVLAKVFATREQINELTLSKMIQITYVATPGVSRYKPEMEAVYLQAWLATRLQWELLSVIREENAIRLSYKWNNTSISVSLIPKDTGILDQGALFSFEAMSYNESHVLITHETESKHVIVHASDLKQCQMPYALFLANYQKGPALVAEIFYQPVSGHYAEALKLLCHKEWAGK